MSSSTTCETCGRPLAEHSRHTRYNHSEKGRARNRRYAGSARGRETKRENNSRRLFASGMYLGMCGFTMKERSEVLARYAA